MDGVGCALRIYNGGHTSDKSTPCIKHGNGLQCARPEAAFAPDLLLSTVLEWLDYGKANQRASDRQSIEPILHRIARQGRHVMNADPVHDLRPMKLDGLGADAEDPGDLLGRLAQQRPGEGSRFVAVSGRCRSAVLIARIA